MNEETITTPTEEVVETITAPEPAPVQEEEKSHIYQPTDEVGRPIGGRQVLKYRTHDELIAKIQEQNVLLIRKLREQTRNSRLGVSYQEDIPAEAPRLKDPLEFKQRHLTAEERVMLSRDLLDPDRFEEASEMLFEASLGAKPQQLREVLADLQARNIQMLAKSESEAFMASNPQYVRCPENSKALVSWITRYNLEPVCENFQKAYDKLRADGILVENPEAEPVSVPEPTPAPVPVAEPPAPEPQPAHVPGISSGLTREQSANTGTPAPAGSDIVYEHVHNGHKRTFTGMAALNAMPSDEYKRRLNSDKTFSKKIEKLMSKK